jgi:hypothetical protein
MLFWQDARRPASRRVYSGQKQGDEDADNGDHYEKLHEGKGAFFHNFILLNKPTAVADPSFGETRVLAVSPLGG